MNDPYVCDEIKRLGLSAGDFREQFIRSPGKGGQNVNKVATAVLVQYGPTGIMAKCHSERSQRMNRLKAWRIVLAKIASQRTESAARARALKEKSRRQKRGRSAKGKEKMLEEKKKHSLKKTSRRKDLWMVVFAVSSLLVFPVPAQARSPMMVCAAASLMEPLTDAAIEFKKEYKVDTRFNFGGSSELKVQILRGAPCDLFLAADSESVTELQKRDLVDERFVANLLRNRLVVVARQGQAARMNSLYDIKLRKGDFLALADPLTSPAGGYAVTALRKAGVLEALAPYLAPFKDVRAALAVVQSGNATYAMTYETDARTAKDLRIVYRIPSALHDPIVYQAAVLVVGENRVPARNFLAFLSTPAIQKVFQSYGFALY